LSDFSQFFPLFNLLCFKYNSQDYGRGDGDGDDDVDGD